MMIDRGKRIISRRIPLFAGLITAMPVLADDGSSAAVSDWSSWNLKVLVSRIIEKMADTVIPLMLAILFFAFVLNIAIYIYAVNKGGKNIGELSQKRLVYPVLALFILFSVWGFVRILQTLFGG